MGNKNCRGSRRDNAGMPAHNEKHMPDTIPHGNNYVWCHKRGSFISTDVCLVQQQRNKCLTAKCNGGK
jgi:hypothetical protein